MNHGPFPTSTMKRTIFPLITKNEPDSGTIFLGCMKAIEETGNPGWIYGANGTREIRDVTVKITQPGEAQ